MVEKLRSQFCVAIVGLGSIGNRHFENLAQSGVGRRIVVRRADSPNAQFKVEPSDSIDVVHSLDAAIALAPDLTIVCNPTRLHVDAALKLIDAGAAVLIEKPICDNPAAAAALVSAVEARQGWAAMAYCSRYHAAYRLAREALLAGRIGRPLYAKAWFEGYLPAWHPWEDYRQSYAARRDLGGGVLPTLDHDLDYLNWCLGPPGEVHGRAWRTGSLETDAADAAIFAIEYPRQVTAQVTASFCRRDPVRGFEFIGSSGSLHFDMSSACLTRRHDEQVEVLWQGGEEEISRMYVAMLEAMLDAIARNQPPPIPLVAGQATLRICAGVPGVVTDRQT